MNTTLRALTNQAERLVRTGVYEEAIALCQAILRRYPRYARCYRILGEAYLGLAEYEEAARLFRRALGVDPEDAVAYSGLAIIFEERGLLEEAIWQLERAFELAPGRDELRRELNRLYQRRGTATPVQLTRAALARLYARGGLWNKAVGELSDLLAREPFRFDLRVTLARTLWRARRQQEAAEVAQSILDQAPNCLVARLLLGTYWCREGREDEGRALLEGAQELDPENREAARLLAKESLLPLRLASVETEAATPEPQQDEVEDADGDQEALPTDLERAATAQAAVEASTCEEEDQPALSAGDEYALTAPAEPAQVFAGDDAWTASEPADGAAPPAALALVAAGLGEEAELQPPEGAGPDDLAASVEGLALDGAAPEAGVETAERPAPEAPEVLPEETVEVPPEEVPEVLSPVAALRRRLDASPDDNQARAELARLLAESGQLAEALPLYDSLATPTSGYLDRVLADLETIARQFGQHRGLRELMGDVYARAGRFQDAMDMYRWVLTPDDEANNAGG